MRQVCPSFADGFIGHANAAESEHPDLWRELRGLWVPEIGVSGTDLLDYGPAQNDGAFQNMDASDWTMAPAGWALNYTEADGDYVALPAEGEVDITGPISILAVFKVDSLQGAGNTTHILGAYNQDNPWSGYGLGILDDAKPRMWNGSAWVSADSATSTGVWYVLIAVNDGSNTTFYVNGVADGSPAHAVPNSFTGTRAIGARRDGHADTRFDGLIGCLLVWARALGGPEITLLSADPYAMLRPRRRLLKAPSAAGEPYTLEVDGAALAESLGVDASLPAVVACPAATGEGIGIEALLGETLEAPAAVGEAVGLDAELPFELASPLAYGEAVGIGPVLEERVLVGGAAQGESLGIDAVTGLLERCYAEYRGRRPTRVRGRSTIRRTPKTGP